MEVILYALALLVLIPLVVFLVTFSVSFLYYWVTSMWEAFQEWREMRRRAQ